MKRPTAAGPLRLIDADLIRALIIEVRAIGCGSLLQLDGMAMAGSAMQNLVDEQLGRFEACRGTPGCWISSVEASLTLPRTYRTRRQKIGKLGCKTQFVFGASFSSTSVNVWTTSEYGPRTSENIRTRLSLRLQQSRRLGR